MHVSRRTSVGLAIGIAVAILYVGLSLTWHRMKWQWFPPEDLGADPFAFSGDPFAALPAEVKPRFPWRERIDPLFYDFEMAWADITSPLKPWDAHGRRYCSDPENGYVTFLRPMGEPSLAERDKGDTNSYFRFLLVPSCGDDAWALRLTVHGQESATLRDSYLKDGIMKPASVREVDVTGPVLGKFRNLIGNPEFWEPLSALEKEEMDLVPLVRTWFIEESTPEGYRSIMLTSPESFADLGKGMRKGEPYTEALDLLADFIQDAPATSGPSAESKAHP